MTESYHFQIEPDPAKEALFRVGGVYRQQNGVIVLLTNFSANRDYALAERVYSPPGEWLNSGGARNLSDGRYPGCGKRDDYECHLLPGELVERDGQWVPTDAPATIGPFGSGASLKTDGSQITGRIEPAPEPVTLGAILRKALEKLGVPADTTAPAEPKRAPLPHFNQRTEFDPFPGFKVRSDTGWMTGEDGHPLQRMTADSPIHGSAHLLLSKTA